MNIFGRDYKFLTNHVLQMLSIIKQRSLNVVNSRSSYSLYYIMIDVTMFYHINIKYFIGFKVVRSDFFHLFCLT